MKRNKPMNRGQGFKHKAPPQRSSTAATLVAGALRQLTGKPAPLAAPRLAVELEPTFNPQPKFPYIRSTTIQVACRTIPCQFCDRRTGTEVWCHSNWAVHGKGTRIKASDQYVAAGCSDCHHELDFGTGTTEAEKQLLWWLAHQRTVLLLCRLGRWPAYVPVPDIATYPF